MKAWPVLGVIRQGRGSESQEEAALVGFGPESKNIKPKNEKHIHIDTHKKKTVLTHTHLH